MTMAKDLRLAWKISPIADGTCTRSDEAQLRNENYRLNRGLAPA
jgi:hypothetical protein